MGLILQMLRALFVRGGVTNLARAGTEVIGALRPNATRQLELGHDAFTAVQAEYAAEFSQSRGGFFDGLVNGLNRLPRPMLALGTLGLFVYAMADPAGFSLRMRGLAEVPEPLWWLLGAVVAFYFGARETYYLRGNRLPGRRSVPDAPLRDRPQPEASAPPNPALEAWLARNQDLNSGRD